MLFFIFVAIAVVVVLVVLKTKNINAKSDPTNRYQNQYPRWTANQNRPSNVNQNTMFDSHLCDDGQHDGQNVSFNNSLGSAYNFSTADTSSASRSTSLSKFEKELEVEKLRSLLDAGIITQEEYYQRKREL